MGAGATDFRSLRGRVDQYLDWILARNYSDQTAHRRRYCLLRFVDWCEARGVAMPEEATRPVLEAYQRGLFHYRKANDRPLSFSTQLNLLCAVRLLFKWLVQQHLIQHNPAAELELPRRERRLPGRVLNPVEAEAVLAAPDVRTCLGLRDRAILETFYSTGIRRTELSRLTVYDLDRERRVLAVRCGKGKKDRMVPIGERALSWVEKYLDGARPELQHGEATEQLFLGHHGQPLAPRSLTGLVHGYVEAATSGRGGACHLFRHSMATGMLNNGADIRFIQEMLGHAELSTTQVYTRVSIQKLQEVHEQTHPASRNQRRSHGDEPGGSS